MINLSISVTNSKGHPCAYVLKFYKNPIEKLENSELIVLVQIFNIFAVLLQFILLSFVCIVFKLRSPNESNKLDFFVFLLNY